MARIPRRETIDPSKIQIVHAYNTCVQQGFLCGTDRATGKVYDHRKAWMYDRFEFLSSLYAVDCLTFAILSNHFHVILRSRPDVVIAWSDKEVAKRWCQLSHQPKRKEDGLCEPTQKEFNVVYNDKAKLAEIRVRLSSISWWMRYATQKIARDANRESGTKGHFWAGRFEAKNLLDEMAILVCAQYVDLNIVRAAIAELPENSEFSGAKQRIDDSMNRGDDTRSSHDRERSGAQPSSGWLSPLQIDEANDPIGPDLDLGGRRASDKGFLRMSLESYLELLDWTGRQVRSDKRGSIPDHLSPILERIGMSPTHWCELVQEYDSLFNRVVGSVEHVNEEAARRGQKSMQAPGAPMFENSAA